MSMETSGAFNPAKILVPVDFSASSDEALEAAKKLAQSFQSQLVLLHVVPVLPNMTCDAYLPEEKFVTELRDAAEAKLVSLCKDLNSSGYAAVYHLECGNDVVGNILRSLKQQKASLLVFSTHGMSGWRPAVFGSIAEQVIKQAGCPVLLLRTLEPVSHVQAEATSRDAVMA